MAVMVNYMRQTNEIMTAIKKELEIGLSSLPAYGCSHLFKIKVNNLARKSMDGLRDWLAIVKQGKIVHKDRKRIVDKFSGKGALRDSLGLVELTEEE